MVLRVIRVYVVDDAASVRKTLVRFLAEDPQIEVVGSAESADEALVQIDLLNPDVVTVDVNMPGMNGLVFLQRVMRTRPRPVIVVSSETRKGSPLATEALRLGAVAALAKPHADYPIATLLADLRTAILATARKGAKSAAKASARAPAMSTNTKVVAVGSSTGGTVAFEAFAQGLPAGHPAVVLAQHLPVEFVPRFVERLADLLPAKVAVAAGSERLVPNTIWVAPGTHHLRVRRDGVHLVTELFDAPPVNFHRPSCDVLLESVARAAGRDAIGVILTGMGADGAKGLLAMRNAGATTFAQDEGTSVVYGMPRAAAELGAAKEVVPIDRMAARVVSALSAR